MDQFSDSSTKALRRSIIFEISILILKVLCMANREALPVRNTEPYKNYNFQIDDTLQYFGVWLW